MPYLSRENEMFSLETDFMVNSAGRNKCIVKERRKYYIPYAGITRESHKLHNPFVIERDPMPSASTFERCDVCICSVNTTVRVCMGMLNKWMLLFRSTCGSCIPDGSLSMFFGTNAMLDKNGASVVDPYSGYFYNDKRLHKTHPK